MSAISIGSYTIPVLRAAALVIGAGAAGLNAADELAARGVDTLVAADRLLGGTSRNAGSDKQTYYKLTLSGDAPDSVGDLARTFFAGGGMHGDTAYALAALSARSFLKLVQLGVPFPHNEWGEFIGYKTDHDPHKRATSAGPLTSRFMAEALARSVAARGVRTREGLTLLSLVRDHGRVCGALFYDADTPARPLLAVCAPRVVLATGGPATLYGHSVFPPEQRGGSGAALLAGARASNLCYWQYGLASTRVRWNLSGSFQQALPAYVDAGSNAFLRPHFADDGDMLDSVFLKGYQWPFDARKLRGSSRVDMAVHAAGERGSTFLDFTKETPGALTSLGAEARTYLANCGALVDMPIERLRRINPEAIEFYRGHGIDLAREPLEMAVCAQHANGGLAVDAWWRTSLPGLYAAGECAGAFGAYRPGGSALNETQVGSLRAAQHIAAHAMPPALTEDAFAARVREDARDALAFFERATRGQGGAWDAAPLLTELRARFSRVAGHVRDVDAMSAMLARVRELWPRVHEAPDRPQRAPEAIALRDALACYAATLPAMLAQAERGGAAGHCVRGKAPGDAVDDAAYESRLPDARADQALPYAEARMPLRPLPEGDGWFETEWAKYREARVFGEA